MKSDHNLSHKQIDGILRRIRNNEHVRRSLPMWGRIHIDRQLPFLCLYRRPPGRSDRGTERLISGEASYLMAEGSRAFAPSLALLLGEIATLMSERFGAFLIMEMWAKPHGQKDEQASLPPRPAFQIIHPGQEDSFGDILKSLQRELEQIKILKRSAGVSIGSMPKIAPPGMPSAISANQARKINCHLIGIEVEPIYRDSETGEVFPLLLRSFKRQIARVLKQFFYEFSLSRTTHSPVHYYSLGRRAMAKAVWDIDKELADQSNAFDFLLQVTPINAEAAWKQFKRKRFEKTPVFYYRPRPVDPGFQKKKLFGIPIDRIEDPTLMHLFLDKQMEIDRKLTMLLDRGTKSFLYGSLQLYGEVNKSVKRVARGILSKIPSRSRKVSKGGYLSVEQFADLARSEIAFYQEKHPEFKATVQVRDDIYPGLMVSHGHLMVGKDAVLPALRAEALLQHEVGTHLLTYYNGKFQPFKMLYTGLPGYDEIQEGLAVLAEYFAGGLSPARLRVLAARVMAVSCMLDGATFVETFRLLNREYDFPQRVAYVVTMRVFRGGGLTKDAVYLRGLLAILDLIRSEGEVERFYIGKIAKNHLPIIKELLLRKILKYPPLRPRFFERADATNRLNSLKEGLSIFDLVERSLL